MSFLKSFLNWSLGLFFALCGLILFNTAPLYSVLTFVIAALFIPPMYRYITSLLNLNISRKVRYIAIVVLFLTSIGVYPQSNIKKLDQVNESELRINTSTTDKDPSVKTSIVDEKVTPTPTLTMTPTPLPTRMPTITPRPTVIVPTSAPVVPVYNPPPQVEEPQTNSGGYSCNCSKVCGAMASCDEAYFQLNTCGCSARDGDNDGVPCETICR